MKKPYMLLTFLFAIVVVLSVVRIALVNNISTTGTDLVAIEVQTQALRKENKLLKEKYLEAASYTTITKKAATMGFAQSKEHVNMAAPLPLAIR